MKKINALVLVSLLAVFALGGCDFLDPARPTIQPDSEIFGNYLEVEEMPDKPGTFVVQVRVSPPRALVQAEEDEGRADPPKGEGLKAEVMVDSDTVVLLKGLPASLGDFTPGAEVVGIPSPGSTRMVGESMILIKAELLMDFETFRRWRLPLLKGEDRPLIEDLALVNSSGVERAPIPVDNGRVLYFSARLRQQGGELVSWVGAKRPEIVFDEVSGLAPERTFRAEFTADGWTPAEPVLLPGLEGAARVSVSWVDAEETECLVTVQESAGEAPWAGRSVRAGVGAPWGDVVPLEGLGEGDAYDAVYLTGSRTRLVFASTRQGANQSDLYLINPPDQPEAAALEPRINTVGSEWGPRTGPDNILFFSRGDRQLTYARGVVTPVFPDTPHRMLFSEAAPTDDGKWVFFTLTRLASLEADLDIWVAARAEDGSLGRPMAVEDWRPEAF